MTLPIQDEYTALEITKQRKYQLRHPDLAKDRQRRYDQSEAGRESRRQRNARYREKHPYVPAPKDQSQPPAKTPKTKQLTGRDWLREQVRKRDNHTCQSCGRVWQ